ELLQSGFDQARTPCLEIDRLAIAQRLDEFAFLRLRLVAREIEPDARFGGCLIAAHALVEFGAGGDREVTEIDRAFFGAEDQFLAPGPRPLGLPAAVVARKPF